MPTEQLCGNCGHDEDEHHNGGECLWGEADDATSTIYGCDCRQFQTPKENPEAGDREARAKSFYEEHRTPDMPLQLHVSHIWAAFAEAEIARERPLIEAEVTAKVIDEFVEKLLGTAYLTAGAIPVMASGGFASIRMTGVVTEDNIKRVADEMKREAAK